MKKIQDYTFVDCDIYNQEIYFFTEKEPAFCKMDIRTCKVSYIESFEKQGPDVFLHKSVMVLVVENKLYSLDRGGRYLLVYDFQQDTYKNIEIGCNFESSANFISMNRYKNSVLIFTKKQNLLVKVDCESDGVTKKELLEKEMGHLNLSCSCQVGDEVLLFQEDVSEVIIYNAGNDNISKIKLNKKMMGCKDVKWQNGSFYILCQNNVIALWNRKDNVLNEIDKIGEIEGGMLFVVNEYICILPSQGDDIYLYNIVMDKVERYKDYPQDFSYVVPGEWKKYIRFCEGKDRYYIAMRASNYMLSLNKSDGEIEWIRPNLPNDYLRLQKYRIMHKNILQESDFSLSLFLETISNDN